VREQVDDGRVLDAALFARLGKEMRIGCFHRPRTMPLKCGL
jgi:hypothetical protein